MTEYARATQYLQINKLVNDTDLFTKSSDDTVLQNFGKLCSSDRMIQRSQMSHYALISFWKMNQQSRQEVMHTYFVEYPLSRDINLSKGLSEVLFLANNIKLPFLFSYVDEQKTSLKLNLLGQPDESDGTIKASDKKRKMFSKASIANNKLFQGVYKFDIGKDSFL